MAQAVQRTQVTPADELRDLLEQSEKRVANVRWSGDAALTLLKDLDRIAELWPQLEAQGVDLRPEAGRWQTLQAAVERNATGILAELQGSGGIKALRQQCHPDGTDAPWWWLDRYVADERRRRIRRTAAIAGSAVVLAVLAYVLIFKVLFPVDPKVVESARRVNQGDELIQEDQDWQGALAEFQAAAAATPDAYDVWLRLGVTQAQVGDEAAAKASYDRARSLVGSELDLLKGRAATYLLFGLIDQADRDNQAALAIKSDDAQAWYQQASVYEARNQVQEAIAALEKASTYAEAAHQDELTALARYRMGMMMQQLGAPQVTVTPAP